MDRSPPPIPGAVASDGSDRLKNTKVSSSSSSSSSPSSSSKRYSRRRSPSVNHRKEYRQRYGKKNSTEHHSDSDHSNDNNNYINNNNNNNNNFGNTKEITTGKGKGKQTGSPGNLAVTVENLSLSRVPSRRGGSGSPMGKRQRRYATGAGAIERRNSSMVGIRPSGNRNHQPFPMQPGSARNPDGRLTARDVSGTKDIEDHIEALREDGRRNVPVYQGVKALWDVHNDRKATRELKLYLVYMIVLLCTVFIGRDIQAKYQFETSLRDSLIEQRPKFETVTLERVDNFGDFWDYLDEVLVPGICEDTWYNGQDKRDVDVGLVNNQIRLVGYLQLRQWRVSSDSCSIPSEFDFLDDECFAMYSGASEEKAPFGPTSNPEKYTWSSGHAWEWGSIVLYYGTGGYVQSIPVNQPQAVASNAGCDTIKASLAELKGDLWLDRHTSAVRISGIFYNVNKNVAGIMRIFIESAPTGNLVKTFSVSTFRFSLYHTTQDHVRAFFEVCFLCFVIYYIGGFIRGWWQDARECGSALPYINSGWAFLDIVTFLTMITLIIVRVVYMISPTRTDFDSSNNNVSMSPETLAIISEIETGLQALLTILSFFRLFKFLRLSDRMSLLWTVLAKSAVDLVPFTIMFFICYISFCVFGHIVFGRSLQEWSTFSSSFAQLFRMLLGDLDYWPMVEVHRVIAPIYLVTFSVLVMFILVNVFLAIITDAYAAVQERLRAKDRAAEGLKLGDRAARVIRRFWVALVSFIACCGLCRRKRHPQRHRRRADSDGDGHDGIEMNGIQRNTSTGSVNSGGGGSPTINPLTTTGGGARGNSAMDDDISEEPEYISMREFLLWVTSGRTAYHKDLEMTRKGLEHLAMNNCAAHGCFLPQMGIPKFVDSPANKELHVCGLNLHVDLDEVQEAMRDNVGITDKDMPDLAMFDHIIMLSRNWVDLDIAEEEAVQISAPTIHDELMESEQQQQQQPAPESFEELQRRKEQELLSRQRRSSSVDGSLQDGANNHQSRSRRASAAGDSSALEARVAAVAKQNEDLQKKLDMVIKLLAAGNLPQNIHKSGGKK